MELKGKNYIVTGASSGIGRATCIELSRSGANVLLVARNQDRLQDTLKLVEPTNHAVINFDLSNIDGIQGIISGAYEKFTVIDGLIYCAGIGWGATLQKTTYELMHSIMLVNCYAFVEFVRCLTKVKPKAHIMRIVGISSVGSLTNNKHDTAYSASKAAMEAAIRVMSTELIKKNTTINSIRPAYVDTEMLSSMQDVFGDFNEHIKSTGFQPLGMIDPVDVAKLAVYLLSDAAKSITGMCVPINGGARF